MADHELAELGPDRTLLLVDDDTAFLTRLARAMEKRGFETEIAETVEAGKAIVMAKTPAYAVIDLRLEDGNGLEVVEALRERRADARIVVLTGYGAIATAVAAVKMGRDGLSVEARRCERHHQRALGAQRIPAAAARKPDERRPRPLGTYPARLRAVRPQRLGNRAAAEHAPPHAATHPGETQPALTLPANRAFFGRVPPKQAFVAAKCPGIALRPGSRLPFGRDARILDRPSRGHVRSACEDDDTGGRA
jgi:Response regulator consisting of a CheY-like receiver domain and a Fis-type HTH domain